MKLRKVVSYVQTDLKQKDLVRTIIPSGFKGSYIVIEEDSSYNLGVSYLPFNLSKKFLEAKRGIK